MKTVEETRRELFLLKILGNAGDADVSRKANGSYSNYYLECIWQGFNSALDAVEIELPSPISEHNTDANGFVSPVAVEYDECIEDCRAAIESTNLGIKVK